MLCRTVRERRERSKMESRLCYPEGRQQRSSLRNRRPRITLFFCCNLLKSPVSD